ncbi:cupredoxin family copper-binding protein [Candidatus Micrarchaeota archaeon]|nr:cupredoxin family copper-binding protein [Candidatus Micrarchaeota archaeon]
MRTFIICMLLAILLLGCSSYQQPPSQQPPGGNQTPSGAKNAAVAISGFKFSPADIQVSAGTNVTWTNEDSVMHTVTFDNGMFNSPSMQHGDHVSYVFNTPGVYTYHCSIHTSMSGSVTVT